MKFHNVLVGTVTALVLTAGAGFSADYECQKRFIGCKTVYVGPADAEAAAKYFADAKGALEWVLQSYPNVESAHYDPKHGEIVIQMKKGEIAGNVTMSGIADHFIDQRLHAERIVLLDNTMKITLNGKKLNRDVGGRTRYFAVNDIPFPGKVTKDEKAVAKARKIFSKVRENTFDDTTIQK